MKTREQGRPGIPPDFLFLEGGGQKRKAEKKGEDKGRVGRPKRKKKRRKTKKEKHKTLLFTLLLQIR